MLAPLQDASYARQRLEWERRYNEALNVGLPGKDRGGFHFKFAGLQL